MCTYGAAIEKKGIEQGIEQGIQKGIQKGVAKEKKDTLERVTRNYMKQDPTLTREEATEKAIAILS